MELLTKYEIEDIDDRVKSCSFENPDECSPEYYIQVRFKYEMGDSTGDGKKEFTDNSKLEVINKVKFFMKDKNRGFDIIF